MDGYILRDKRESVTLPAAAVDRLLQSGQGDAALLYLALRRFGRGVTPEELEKALPISRLRIDAAEKKLQELSLLPRPEHPVPPAPAEERPVYTTQDIAGLITDNEGFRLLVPQTEQQLGKPADVIYLLVCHCVERAKRRWGEGRRPTLRQIEKEGYHWAQLGIFDQSAAAVYLKKWAEREGRYAAYLRALQIRDRQPVEAERRYIDQWMDMGFPPETVALAYERTVFYKKDLNWRYLNGILRRWHDASWHTPQQVEQGEQRGASAPSAKPAAPSGGDRDAWMRRYIKR